MRTTGDAQGLLLSSITPIFIIRSSSLRICSVFSGWTLYGDSLVGRVSGFSSILWVQRVVLPGISLKISEYWLNSLCNCSRSLSGKWSNENVSLVFAVAGVKPSSLSFTSNLLFEVTMVVLRHNEFQSRSIYIYIYYEYRTIVHIRNENMYALSIFTWQTRCVRFLIGV